MDQTMHADVRKGCLYEARVHLNDLCCNIGYIGKPGCAVLINVSAGDLSRALSSVWFDEDHVQPAWVASAVLVSVECKKRVDLVHYGHGIFGPV